MQYPIAICNLIESYKKLPGIGTKTAERMALATLKMNDNDLKKFYDTLQNLKKNVKSCKVCGNLSDGEICNICNDNNRDKSIICVVEDEKNINSFEKLETYNGMYHVLHGLISPLDGINPEDINLKSLFDRINIGNVKEIILALKPSIEGKTTSLYISKKLENNKDVIISRIANGIPLGSDLDYLDSFTLELALEDRKQISD